MQAQCHTEYGMKMTMHIDEALLDRVMESHGFASKTEAVEMALRELDRKARFREFVASSPVFTPDELKAAVDPDYDVHAMRAAETPKGYGKRKSVRRSR